MTTTESPSTSRPPESAPDASHRAASFRRAVAGTCLLAAPVAFAAAELLGPESEGTSAQMLSSFASHRAEGLLAALLGLLSVMLFLPGIFGMLTHITGRGRRWGHAAAAAIIYGLVTAHAALGGVNIMFYAMTDPSLDRTQMVRLMDVLTNTPSAGVPLLLGHEVFGLGIVALGVAVIRSRVFPRWTGMALILWLAVDLTVGSLPAPRLVGDVASNIFGVAALATIGWLMLTRPATNPA